MLVLGVVFCAGLGCGDKAPDKQEKREKSEKPVKPADFPDKVYPFESAVIEYDLKGESIKDGIMTVFIDEYGMKEKKIAKWESRDGEVIVETAIINGKKKITIDYDTGSGTEEWILDRYEAGMAVPMKKHKPKSDLKQSIQHDERERRSEKEKIAGLECTIMEIRSGDKIREIAAHKGLILREVVLDPESRKPIRTKNARSIRFDVKLSPEEFAVPPNIRLIED